MLHFRGGGVCQGLLQGSGEGALGSVGVIGDFHGNFVNLLQLMS